MSDLVTAIISNSVVLAAIGFVTKAIINRHLDRDTATFKSDLQASSNKEIERFRSTLETERLRLQISYGGIFEQQAKAIIELYRLATDFRRTAAWALDVDKSDTKFFEDFMASWRTLDATYNRHRVLLPVELDQKFHIFVDDFYSKVFQHQRLQAQYGPARNSNEVEHISMRQEALRDAIEKDMPALLEEMVSMSRELLGTRNSSLAGVG